MPSVKERFWDKVDVRADDDCWVWQAARFRAGYGAFKVDGQTVGAHVFSWKLHHQKPLEGQQVNHHCGNHGCVNPKHLYAGTHPENMKDSDRHGRTARGSTNGRARLTEADVRSIREQLAAGATPTQIAAEYGTTPTSIVYIHKRKTWKHVA